MKQAKLSDPYHDSSELVHVDCNLCENDDAKYICHVNAIALVRCRQCGLYYLNPRPSSEALRTMYATTYYPPTADLKKRSEELWGPETPWTWASMAMFTDVAKHLQKLKPSGRALDVGCGYGIFLKVLADHGFVVRGVDYSELAVRYATQELGLDVSRTGLEEARFPNGSFDVVTMNGVAEHLEDPLTTFAEVNRILEVGGLFSITAPNVLLGLPLVYLHKLFLGNMVKSSTVKTAIFDAPRHLYFFSPETLGRLLEKAGFEIVSVYNGVPIKNPQKRWTVVKQLAWRAANAISFMSGGSILVGNAIAIYARKRKPASS